MYVKINIREQMQNKDENDTADPIYRRGSDPDRLEHLSDQTTSSQKDDPGISTDKRCAHRAKQRQNEKNPASLQLIESEKIRKGNTQQQADDHDSGAYLEAVHDRIGIVAFRKELNKCFQRETVFFCVKGFPHKTDTRIDKEYKKQQQESNGDPCPYFIFFVLHICSPLNVFQLVTDSRHETLTVFLAENIELIRIHSKNNICPRIKNRINLAFLNDLRLFSGFK